jgi:glycine/D-amino acid oxidase-like deaminating enzyme
MELWRQQTLVPVNWCGALVCRRRPSQQEGGSGSNSAHAHPDYPAHGPLSAAELRRLEPGLQIQQGHAGLGWWHYPSEGCLDPVLAARTFVREASERGGGGGGGGGGGSFEARCHLSDIRPMWISVWIG